ncbi:e2aede6b-a07f-4e32-96b3-e96fa25bb5d0 [Sclerotinia trifoliorum]|uniref:E2aede6b-a07f-4e32-96b3-e96fa25bb5d0 n=1 Tax=Sclerotinia trifoliorum TaxID=28548 RepID=A0A8H2VRQ3_9HELO|nr:e2aede6b-a07f-4e32-96b3-e96fa25bb5d0 [Sclerotinia trifoliorum]
MSGCTRGLIRNTYETAGLDFHSTTFFEAHGTGTAVGDPIEASAIGQVLGEGRSSTNPIYVGALKSNISHLEGDSGIAGLIKTIFALEKSDIPPNANFEKFNPKIDAKKLNLAFPQECIPWPVDGLRRASVNSFGFGGSNAHFVLDDAYNFMNMRGISGQHQTATFRPSVDSVISPTLPGMLSPHIGQWDDIASIRESSPESSTGSLKEFIELEIIPSFKLSLGTPKPQRYNVKTSAQYAKMGHELMAYTIFHDSLKMFESHLSNIGCRWSLLEELLKDDEASKINNPEMSQMICTAIQVAIVDLLHSFGVFPAAVIGHSSGETAAAYASEALSMLSACKVAYFRGKLAEGLAHDTSQHGAMLAAGLSETQAMAYTESLLKDCPMDSSLRITMISSVTGCEVQSDQLKKASYWVRNMVSPVRFSEALIKAVSYSCSFKNYIHFGQHEKRQLFNLLEIGPHSALQGPIKDTLATIANGKEVSYGSVLKRKSNGINTLLNAVGSLTCLGYPVDIIKANMIDKIVSQKSCDLGKNYRLRKQPRLDLLGTEILGSNAKGMKWRKITRISETPWIQDHVVNESTIYPAAGMLVMAIQAAMKIASLGKSIKGYLIKDTSFPAPLRVASDDLWVESVFHIVPLEDKFEKTSLFVEFSLSTLQNERWENCHGMIQVQYESSEESLNPNLSSKASMIKDAVKAGVTRCNQTIEPDRMYKKFEATGLTFGSTLQSLNKISIGPNLEACADVEAFRWTAVDDSNHRQDHIIHPITLDAMLQTILVSLTQGNKNKSPTAVPTRVASLWILGSGLNYPKTGTIRVYGKVHEAISRGNNSTAYAVDRDTEEGMVATSGLETTFVYSGSNKDEIINKQKLCYQIDWKPNIDFLDQPMAREYCRKGVLTKDLSQCYEDMSLSLTHFSLETQAKVDSTELDGTRPHYQSPTGPAEIEAIDMIMNSLENVNAEGKMFVEPGRNIVNILKGNIDPLDILSQTDLASRYSQEVNIKVKTTLACVVELIPYKSPGLKVIEIGAGTDLSPIIFRDLPLSEEQTSKLQVQSRSTISQTFSPSFLEAARQKFENEDPKFQLLLLDASIDPGGQGCEVGGHDLVIAAYVLHATEKFDNTVRNARKLLKKSGKCVNRDHRELLGSSIRFWHIARMVLRRNDFSGTDLAVNDCDEPQSQVCSAVTIAENGQANTAISKEPARVLRTEYSDQKFVTLTFENKASPGTITRNIRVFEKVVSTEVCNLDQEYRENANQIVINRAIAADYLNAHVQKTSKQQHTVLQTIGKSPPLRLDIGTALQFSILIEDEKETQIGFQEVEIQVKAIVLDPYNFKEFASTAFEQMSYDQWCTTIKPRVQGSRNLHSLLPKGMEFFLLHSSITGVVGTGGQANYAAGNTFMDALARARLAAGEKAVSLDLGSTSGLAAANKQLDYAELLSKAKSLPEAVKIVEAGLLNKLSGALGIPVYSIDTRRPIHVYGVDSLLVVSLRGWFKKEFRPNISVFDIIGNSSLDAVRGMVASKSQWFRGPVDGVTM